MSAPAELYDGDGRRIGYLHEHNSHRAFVLNDVGTGELNVPRNTLMVPELMPDRLVMIRSRHGLVNWAGVIVSVEYTWESVSCQLREGLVLLAQWNGFGYPIGRYLEGLPGEQTDTDTAAALIAQAIGRINTRNRSRLRMGAVQIGSGLTVSLTHTPDKSVLDEIRELHDVVGFDYWTEAVLDAGRRLAFQFHAADQRGRDRRRHAVLWEGHSLGAGSNRKQLSGAYGEPVTELVEVQCTDTALWSYLQVGDRISIRSKSLDLNHDGRILGMEPDEQSGVLTLAMELD